MTSSVTRYTNRCSWVTRRDQQPASTYLRGSGFPSPWNGSRITASTRSNTLIAVLRSVLTQKRRSSRNLAGAQQLVHILSGAYSVVPAPEHFVGNEVELTHFRV